MTKVIAFVRSLVTSQKRQAGIPAREGWAVAAKQAHADGQDTLIAEDIFTDENIDDWKW